MDKEECIVGDIVLDTTVVMVTAFVNDEVGVIDVLLSEIILLILEVNDTDVVGLECLLLSDSRFDELDLTSREERDCDADDVGSIVV